MKFIVVIYLAFMSCFAATSDVLIEFELEDQFEKIHTKKEFEGLRTILLVSTTKDVETHKLIVKELASLQEAKKQDNLKVMSIFNMKSVPSFLRFFARGKFPQEKDKTVLIDWEGKFHNSYSLKEEEFYILIFDKDMKLVLKDIPVSISNTYLKSIL